MPNQNSNHRLANINEYKKILFWTSIVYAGFLLFRYVIAFLQGMPPFGAWHFRLPYIFLLFVYGAVKETAAWYNIETQKQWGQRLIFVWFTLLGIMGILTQAFPGRFPFDSRGPVIENLSYDALSTLSVLAGTLLLKFLQHHRTCNNKHEQSTPPSP